MLHKFTCKFDANNNVIMRKWQRNKNHCIVCDTHVGVHN